MIVCVDSNLLEMLRRLSLYYHPLGDRSLAILRDVVVNPGVGGAV